MCDASDETAERGKSLGFDEVALRLAGLQSGFSNLPLVPYFGEQCSENERGERHQQNTELRGQNPLGQ